MSIELKNFSDREFLMDGVVVFDRMDADFLLLLDKCREVAGVPMKLTSSWRSAAKNKAVGGAKSSMHLKGRAVDVRCLDGAHRAAIMKTALSIGLTVGVMENALHLDNREKQTVFHYYHQYRRK